MGKQRFVENTSGTHGVQRTVRWGTETPLRWDTHDKTIKVIKMLVPTIELWRQQTFNMDRYPVVPVTQTCGQRTVDQIGTNQLVT